MLSKSEIVDVLVSIKEESELLTTIEKIAHSDSFTRNSFIDVLVNKFRSENRPELLIQFAEELRSNSFCPVVLGLLKELKDNNFEPKVNSWTKVHLFSLYSLVLVLIVLVLYINNQKGEEKELNRVTHQQLKSSQKQNEELGNELKAIKDQDEKELKLMKRSIVGVWESYNPLLDDFSEKQTFERDGKYKAIITDHQKVRLINGTWKISDHSRNIVVEASEVNSDKPKLKRKKVFRLKYVDQNVLVFNDGRIKVRKRVRTGIRYRTPIR